MGFLKLDYDNVNDGFEPLPIGDYECIVSAVEVTKTKGGEGKEIKPMLKLTLTVRDDVEQDGQKRKFFDNLVEQENMMWKFSQVGKAAGVSQDVSSLEDFASQVQYQNVLIRNKHRMYEGEKQDTVGYYKASGAGGYTGDMGAGAAATTVDVDDDDLPF